MKAKLNHFKFENHSDLRISFHALGQGVHKSDDPLLSPSDAQEVVEELERSFWVVTSIAVVTAEREDYEFKRRWEFGGGAGRIGGLVDDRRGGSRAVLVTHQPSGTHHVWL